MPNNIEIKARVHDLTAQKRAAAALATAPLESFDQVDTFFNAARGRLKLRQFAEDRGQLIQYERDDAAGPKSSSFSIIETREPEALRNLLASALGVRGVVRKHRDVYHAGQTRIHLDQVDGLGNFLELEVVLEPHQGAEAGAAIARRLMEHLDVREEDLIEGAYLDLLLPVES